MSGLPPESVKLHLAVRAAALAEQLFPDGKLEGAEWIGRGPDGAKWGVVIKGGKSGAWQNFAAGRGGRSLLSLIRDAVCGGDHLAAYRWALAWLGDGVAVPAPAALPAASRPPERPKTNGLALYLAGQPFSWQSPAGRYLRSRGLEFLPAIPKALRWHPECWNADVNRNMPAMLAPIVHPIERRQIAVHRTYLERSADGGYRKASVPKAKKVLGSPVGGLIPLARGASGRPWSKMDAGERLLLAEGIEDALTGSLMFPELRCAAYVAAGNLNALDLPETVAEILLLVDRDGENWVIREGREEAIYHWQKEGRGVELWRPPEGVHDANDFWRQLLLQEA